MLHLTGTVLLDGGREAPEAWVGEDGLLRLAAPEGFRPGAAGVTELRGVTVPGLVDVHCHVGIGDDGPVSDDAGVVANAQRDLATGVLLIRDCGSPVDTSVMHRRDDLPVYLSAAQHVARPKRYIRGLAQELEDVRDLPEEIARQARASGAWVKIVGDWIDRADGVDSDLQPLWPLEVLRDAVAAAHENGARVTIHTFERRTAEQAIEAGVDCLEHGTDMDADLIAEAAARGIPVTGTLMQVGDFAEIAGLAGTKYPIYRDHMLRMHAHRYEQVAALHDAGVQVLPGTDASTLQPHGSMPIELAEMAKAIPADELLALATWKARRFLGQPSLDEGQVADLVVYTGDPRRDVGEYARPAAVVRAGRILP